MWRHKNSELSLWIVKKGLQKMNTRTLGRSLMPRSLADVKVPILNTECLSNSRLNAKTVMVSGVGPTVALPSS